MKEKIQGIMILLFFPSIILSAAYFESAIDQNNVILFVIAMAFVVFAGIDFALVWVSCLVEK